MLPHPRHPGLVLVALASGFVMASIDSTVVNVAVVAIGAGLGGSLTEMTWVVDVYVLTFASLLLLGGSLATAYGSRRLYLAGMHVFLVASLGCAVAPTAPALIGARALEGVGAALFMPSSLALLVGMFPERRRRARMLGLWSAMVATSAALGPTLGGVLVATFGWRSIFLVNLPVVVGGVLLTHRVIPATRGGGGPVSPAGHVLVLAAVASGAYVLIQGHSSGFTSISVAGAAVLLVTSAVLLAAHQARTASPVVPWHLFTRPAFAVPNVVGFLYSGGLYGNLFLTALFLQDARHVSALHAGLQLLPATVCFPLGNLVYTRIHDRFSNASTMAFCLGLAGTATLFLLPVTSGTPYWYLAVVLCVANSGAGLVTASMTAAVAEAAGDHYAGYAGAILNANRQLGVLVGVAVIGLVLQGTADWYRGLHEALALVAAAYLMASATAFALARRTRHESGSDVSGTPRQGPPTVRTTPAGCR